ncbi:MAG: DUF1003 domain-containing protein [Ancrocorticia sp.]|jgi:uncharacterized membrane protein|nr:DUF1003 domain-containing protein [Ancrocorticia sp.]MCI1896740.1 DUF1003 domain-containing protein [Ancrocorticia sp.]MCI1933444.1 DUF1003 domain-containing protein [Ancrocorticia sp.]MCI1963165.1 DUF1003 domain-containing protein [Ancrocorticia sp.]MCI2001533.1 DUF1003 domain-containing protein [Ancrocorticia sp.]
MSDFDKPLETSGRRRLRWRRNRDSDAFGRFAETVARFMGSPKFILYMTIFVTAWIVANVVLVQVAKKYAWDPYPFILLNLAFSTQASYSAPLILLAQNRQDDRDRVIAEQDRQRAERNLADTEYLTREIAGLRMAIGDVATRDFVRSELRDALESMERTREDRVAERDTRIAELQRELDALRALHAADETADVETKS